MRSVLRCIAPALLLCLAASAHATTISAGTYTLDNADVKGYSVTGTITFNASGDATAVDLSFLDPAYNSSPVVFNQIVQTNTYSGLGQDYFTASNSSNGGQIALYFDNSSDANGDFDLCIGNATCGTSGSDPSTLQVYGYNINTAPWYIAGFTSDFTSGYIAADGPVSVTPEPSSLALLGTGILGFAGVMRRRLLN